MTAVHPVAARSPDRTGVCCAGRSAPSQCEWSRCRAFHRQISPIKSGPRPIVPVQGRIRIRMPIELPWSAIGRSHPGNRGYSGILPSTVGPIGAEKSESAHLGHGTSNPHTVVRFSFRVNTLWYTAMSKITNMFPLSIYKDKVQIDNDYKRQLVEKILEMGKYDIRKNPNIAWTGDVHAFEFLHRDELFQSLFRSFSKPLLEYIENLGVDPQKIDLFYTRSWPTISRQNQNIPAHSHVQSHISIAYYLLKPTNSGGIIFSHINPQNEFSPNLFNSQMFENNVLKEDNPFNAKAALLDPHESEIVIFPSKTRHQTQENTTPNARISISADIVVTLREQANVEFLMPNINQWGKITLSHH